MVVVNVPAYNHLYSKYDVEVGHKRRYTKEMLSQAFQKEGIIPIKLNYWGAFLYPVAVIRKAYINSKKENIIQHGMKPPNQLAETFLRTISKMEYNLPLNFPFGTSLIGIGKKQ